jgi:hypothetical protein
VFVEKLRSASSISTDRFLKTASGFFESQGVANAKLSDSEEL